MHPFDEMDSTNEPSHPELLDWLACELRDHDWSIEHLHQIILTSATYQRASYPVHQPAAATGSLWQRLTSEDPDNARYGRFPRRRLEGEIVRDALLAVSGQLDRRYGGPSVMPPLPQELTSTLLRGQWKVSPEAADHVRRGIYIFARRNLRYPIFDVFDRPAAGASCAIRDKSTTATQSLQMLNSELTLQAAQSLADQFADRLMDADTSEARQSVLDGLFRRVLGRPAVGEELRRLEQVFSDDNSQRENLTTICVALLNTSEFIYID